MTTIAPLPPSPLPSDDEFTLNDKMFATFGAFPGFIDQTNALGVEANAAAAAAALSQGQAAASRAGADAAALAAQAAAAASAASAGAQPWQAGNYGIGQCARSTINFLIYAARTNGNKPTDPSLDDVNWGLVAPNGLQMKTIAGTAGLVAANSDTCFTNAAACAATVGTLAVGESFVVRFDNGRLDNTVDLGARAMLGPNGVVCSGVITLNTQPFIALRWWGDYYRSN